MINQAGEKIRENKERKDPGFLMAEIKFLMKGFQKESCDSTAYITAKTVNEFLDLTNNINAITDYLLILEKYSHESRSDDFVWELVYIRRKIARYCGGKEECAESKFIAAEHFNKICEIRPTVHNRCCRVLEYITAAKEYFDFESTKTKYCYLKAEELFEEIEDNEAAIYYQTGETLYLELIVKFNHIKNDDKQKTERFKATKKLSYFGFKVYELDPTPVNLSYAANYYITYIAYPQFSYEQEKDNLNTLLRRIEKAMDEGVTLLKRKYEELKKRRDAFEGDQ